MGGASASMEVGSVQMELNPRSVVLLSASDSESLKTCILPPPVVRFHRITLTSRGKGQSTETTSALWRALLIPSWIFSLRTRMSRRERLQKQLLRVNVRFPSFQMHVSLSDFGCGPAFRLFSLLVDSNLGSFPEHLWEWIEAGFLARAKVVPSLSPSSASSDVSLPNKRFYELRFQCRKTADKAQITDLLSSPDLNMAVTFIKCQIASVSVFQWQRKRSWMMRIKSLPFSERIRN